MKSIIQESITDSIAAVTQLQSAQGLAFIEETAQAMAACFKRGGKILIAGNGGSLCDAMHFAEELTGVFRTIRPALPVIALTDPGHLTCIGNDLGFDWVFARAVQAFGKPEDLFVGLTTSGNSPNIINAMDSAKEIGLSTVLLLGKGGGKLKGKADFELSIDGFSTSDRIQEAHMAALHIIIEIVEILLFPELCGSKDQSVNTQSLAEALHCIEAVSKS